MLNLARVLAILLFVVVTVRVAWISDDALITLRSALNITHGWGPGYNATESVQAYTHPLWFLLWVGIGSWTNQWILGLFAVSALLVAIAVALLLWRAKSLGRLLVAVALLLLSNAFIDFTTSGLENPLSYATVGLLISLTLTKVEDVDRRSLIWAGAVGLTTAAVFLTRMDLLALILIPLVLVAWQQRKRWRLLLLGLVAFLIPVVLWFTWTWLTYAALLPNTFAAKTNAVIPQSEFLVQGLRYLWVSFEQDPVTMIGIAIGVGVGLAFGPALLRGWSMGILTYIAYVVWVGGDFMGGRFLAVPLYGAVFILASSPINASGAQRKEADPLPLVGAIGAVLMLLAVANFTGTKTTSLANPQAQRWQVDQNFNAGIVDARGSSVENADSLKHMIDNLSLAYVDPDFAPIGDGTGLARALRNLDKSAANWPINDGNFTTPSEVGVFCGYLGNIGIATGPTTHLIDNCALTDRFLAERPFIPAEPFAWKPGHFHRDIPEGYAEAVATGDPKQLKDPVDAFRLQQLWNAIR